MKQNEIIKNFIGLDEAEQLVNISKEQIRKLAHSHKIRGKKFGSWRFNPDFLKEDINLLLENEVQIQQWESSKEKTAPIGNYRTRMQTVKDYEQALNLKPKKKAAANSQSIS